LMSAGSGPLWAAASSFFVGVGMGLTSTSFIVTIQGAVSRAERGAATAANMFMRNFGNTVGAAIFGAVLNSSLMSFFSNQHVDYGVNDINALLTEETRQQLPVKELAELQAGLDHSLQWVYGTVALFAVISLLFILRIPRGKVNLHDND